MEALAWTCLLAPLVGVVVLTLAGSRISRQAAAWAGTAFAFVAFAAAVGEFIAVLGEGASHRSHTYTAYTWAASLTFKVPMSVLIDPLAVTEMLIVAGVGAVIVMYSIGYMHGDPKERRFFVYLDLFLFSMLLLVMASNFVLLLAGWGLVGLSSYLLIGFWHERPEPVAAAKKAFVMNAIGDVGIILAVFFMARDLGTTNYATVFHTASAHWPKGSADANWVAGLLLLGALAKSAQIPLHTWLPDAMEGPTPVSALIHAATMVTAGVYLVARAHALFILAPDIEVLIALIGVATLLMAGVIAIVQTDIKRIIAYSTMSQIGYMFTAVGLGAWGAGMFHLLAHSFFKALLFLGAGIVIHALGGEQDVRRMGGLGSALPRTKWLMWIGTVALVGFWPLSKDEVLSAALQKDSTTAIIVWVGGLVGTFFTGIYATRLMRLTFYGERSQYASEHLHTEHGEAPWEMFWPVAILAAGTLVAGLLDIGFGISDIFSRWLGHTAPTIVASTDRDLVTTAIAWTLGGGGALLTWRAYTHPELLERLKRPLTGLAVVAAHKFYWDELYDKIAYLPAAVVASSLYRFFERWVIWGTVGLVAYLVRMLARATVAAQTGVVRLYATALVAGAVVLGAYFLSRATL